MDERALRVQLAATYRIFDMMGWTELIYNHISLRVPGPELHFLINPFGLHYSEVTASNLLKIDLQGNIIGESKWPFNPAGFTPHATIHAGIPDAHCVMHVHTTAGMGVPVWRRGCRSATSIRRSCTANSRTTTSRASRCMPKKARGCCKA